MFKDGSLLSLFGFAICEMEPTRPPIRLERIK